MPSNPTRLSATLHEIAHLYWQYGFKNQRGRMAARRVPGDPLRFAFESPKTTLKNAPTHAIHCFPDSGCIWNFSISWMCALPFPTAVTRR